MRITRYLDASFPGFVECILTDAAGRDWTFVEKVPVIATDELDEHSAYPLLVVVLCTVVSRRKTARGEEWMTIDTSRPWGMQATTGETRFDVLPEQLADVEPPPR